jgi:7-carboxy-7-deazaguanine synthase
MLISEIFYSIQGEGELAGVPSAFIRTTGCNLRCAWCDTRFASWEPEGTEMPIDGILRQVEAFPARHCVLTGGEPMVARGIHDLAAALRQRGWHITIETAGTIPPAGIACDLASLSPKLQNSTPGAELPTAWRAKHERLRWQPGILQEWIGQYPWQLKFVVVEEQDLAEITALPAQLDCAIPPHKILLMPEGVTAETLHQRSLRLVEICKERGFRYCPRLHVDLFGQRRGV